MNIKLRSRKAFTLAEVLIAMTIGSFMLASSYAVIISLAKGSESMINFSEMNNQTRLALETFGRDMRMARNVKTAGANSIRIERDISGTPYDVVYTFVPTAGSFSRYIFDPGTSNPASVTRPNWTLLFDVEELNLNYYTLGHADTTNPIEVKHVQLEAILQRKVLNLTNTNYIISARFMMRNKHVSK